MLFPKVLDCTGWGVLRVKLEMEVHLLPRLDPFFFLRRSMSSRFLLMYFEAFCLARVNNKSSISLGILHMQSSHS
jgi:hypothetical protein